MSENKKGGMWPCEEKLFKLESCGHPSKTATYRSSTEVDITFILSNPWIMFPFMQQEGDATDRPGPANIIDGVAASVGAVEYGLPVQDAPDQMTEEEVLYDKMYNASKASLEQMQGMLLLYKYADLNYPSETVFMKAAFPPKKIELKEELTDGAVFIFHFQDTLGTTTTIMRKGVRTTDEPQFAAFASDEYAVSKEVWRRVAKTAREEPSFVMRYEYRNRPQTFRIENYQDLFPRNLEMLESYVREGIQMILDSSARAAKIFPEMIEGNEYVKSVSEFSKNMVDVVDGVVVDGADGAVVVDGAVASPASEYADQNRFLHALFEGLKNIKQNSIYREKLDRELAQVHTLYHFMAVVVHYLLEMNPTPTKLRQRDDIIFLMLLTNPKRLSPKLYSFSLSIDRFNTDCNQCETCCASHNSIQPKMLTMAQQNQPFAWLFQRLQFYAARFGIESRWTRTWIFSQLKMIIMTAGAVGVGGMGAAVFTDFGCLDQCPSSTATEKENNGGPCRRYWEVGLADGRKLCNSNPNTDRIHEPEDYDYEPCNIWKATAWAYNCDEWNWWGPAKPIGRVFAMIVKYFEKVGEKIRSILDSFEWAFKILSYAIPTALGVGVLKFLWRTNEHLILFKQMPDSMKERMNKLHHDYLFKENPPSVLLEYMKKEQMLYDEFTELQAKQAQKLADRTSSEV